MGDILKDSQAIIAEQHLEIERLRVENLLLRAALEDYRKNAKPQVLL